MATTLYVGSGKDYATINAAIDAARSIDGEVIIEIAAGVYDEYVHLETALLQEKSLTFQGETDSLVVMKGGLEIGDYGQNKNITKDLKFCNIKFEANPGADNNYNATAEDDKKKVQINNAGSPAGGSITFDNCSFYAVDKDGNRGDAYIDEAYILVQQRNAHGNGYFCNVKYNECDFSNGRISFYMGNGGNEFIGCTFNNAPINDQTGNYKYTDCVFNADLSKIADGSDYYVVRINRDSSNSDIFDGAVFNVSNSGNVDFTEIKTDNIIWIRSQESITTEAVLKNVTINGLDADNMAGVNPFGNTLCNGDKTASWNGEEEKIFVRGLVVDGFESEDDIKALLARTSGVLHAVVGNKYYIYNDGEFASAADISTIFVDAAYTEDNVGEGKVFGVNAFDSFTAALEFAQLGVKEIKINGELTDNVQAITSNVQVAKEAVVSGKVVVGHFGFYGEKITDDGKMSATLEVQGTVNAKNTSYFWVGETYGAEFADGTRFVLDVNGGTVNDTTETGLNLRSSGSVKVWNGGKFFTRAIVNEGGDILVSGKDSLVTASIEGGDVVNLLAGSLTIEDEGKVQIAGPWGGLTFKVGNDVEVSITSNGVLEFLNGKNNLINNGTITVNGGKLLADNVTNNGTFTVSGESTLNIASLTGNALSVVGTTTLTDSTIGGNVYAGYSYTNDADLTIKGSFNANILIIGNKSENYTDGTVHTLNINTGDKVAEFGTLNIRTTTDASIENSIVKSGDLFVRGSLEVSDSTLDQNTTIKGGTGHWAVYENGDSTKTASLVIKNSTLTNTSSAKAINYLIVGSNSNGESNADSNAYVSLENSSLAVNTLYLQGAEAFQENYVELTDGSSITTNKIWIGDYASLSVTDSEVTATNVTNNGTFTVAGSSLVKVDSGSGSVDLRGTLLAGSKIKGMALHIDDFASEIQTNADTATEVGSICINYNNADAVKDATLTVNGGGILNSGAVYLGWADKKADFIVSGTGTQVNMGMFLNFYNSSVTIKEGAVVKSNSAAVYGDFKVDGATYTASVDGFGISDRYSQYYESDGIELSITNKATFNTSRLGVGNWYYNGPGDALWNGATIIVDNSTVNASGVILNNYTDDAKVSAVIKLSNGAVVKANSAVVNGNGGYTFYLGARNELKMDVTSSIETNKFEGSGVITVDAAGFTETAKLIDASAWSFTGDINVDINVMAADSKVDTLVFNNDLYITDADKSTLYVSSAYADAEVGDIVDGKIIGYNAFSDVADAIGKMDDSTLKIAVSGEISSKWLNQSGQDAFNSPYDKTIDYALNFEKAEDAESAVIDATENSDWVSYVFTKDVTVGEGVTLQLYDYEANQKTWDNFINFAPVDDTLTMTVNGTLIYSSPSYSAIIFLPPPE